VKRIWQGFLRQVVFFEGSTRGVAVMRILLALIVWARFAADVSPWNDNIRPDDLLLAFSLFASSTLMLLGLFARASTAWTGGTLMVMYYGYGVYWQDQPWNEHNVYMLAVAVCLLALTPCGRSYSFDRYWAARKGGAPEERGALWGTRLLGLLPATAYFWSATEKSTAAFLSGERLEAIFMHNLIGSDYPTFPGFHEFIVFVSIVTVAFEYTLPFVIWVYRWQKVFIPAGLAVHALFYVLIPVKTFSVLMFVLYIAYLHPDWVHRSLALAGFGGLGDESVDS
jgi:hypothetical protein